MSPVETLLQLGDGRDYFVHAGYRAKDHARHGFIVPPQSSEHSVVRSQSEAAGSSRGQVEIEIEASDRILPHTNVLTGPDRLVVDFVQELKPRALDDRCLLQLGDIPAFIDFNGASP